MVRRGAVGSLMEENVIESPAIVYESPHFSQDSNIHPENMNFQVLKKEQRRTKFTDHGKFGSSHIQTYEFSQPILRGPAPRRCVHDALGYGPGVGTVSSAKIGPSWVNSC